MAKKRPIARGATTTSGDVGDNETRGKSGGFFGSGNASPFHPISIASMLVGVLFVSAVYFTGDSNEIELGKGLYFAGCCILLWMLVTTHRWLVVAAPFSIPGAAQSRQRLSFMINLALVALAAWMVIAAFMSSPPGNLRRATNEAWFWVGGSMLLIAARSLLGRIGVARAAIVMVITCCTYLSVHSLHQHFVSMPELQSQYRENPEQVLNAIGSDAAPGSVERMLFESRLYDNGSPATFALANSLAGMLLIGISALVGTLCLRFLELANSKWRLVVMFGVLLLLVIALVFLRSRSALLAMVCAIVSAISLRLILRSDQKSETRGNLRLLLLSVSGVIGLGLVVSLSLAAFGKAEWFDQAPQSIAFRMQYWRTTFAMSADRPLFSAGPGNFQSIYEQYREDSAIEDPAEPHNFLFETLGAGGFIAVGLLVVLVYLLWRYSRMPNESSNMEQIDESDSAVESGFVFWGAVGGLLAIWLLQFATGQNIDLEATVLAIPIAFVVPLLIWPIFRSLEMRELKFVAGIAIMSVLIHLLASGGFTIPGVAFSLWICVALVSAIEWPAQENREAKISSSPPSIMMIISLGLLLLALLKWVSIDPVQNAEIALARAEYYAEPGRQQFGRAQTEAAIAVASDTWSPVASLWQSGLILGELVAAEDSASARERLQKSWERAAKLAGQDPPLMKEVADQQLLLFQRFGKQDDLEAAKNSLSRVLQWSPTDIKSIAQAAEVHRQLGDEKTATAMADRARELSQIDDNLERSLEKQLILVARFLGNQSRLPSRVTASELLANLFSS